MHKERLQFWQAILITLAFLASAFVTLFFAGLLRAAGLTEQAQQWSMTQASRDPINIVLAQVTGSVVALWLGLNWMKSPNPIASFHLGRVPKIRSILLSVIAGISLQFPMTELANALHHYFPRSVQEQIAMQQLLNPTHWLTAVITTVAIALIAPLSEELLFRGLILRGLFNRYGRSFAMVASALLFGLAHMGIIESIYASLIGLLLALLFFRSNNLWLCVILHASFNATPLILSHRNFTIPGFNTISQHVEHLPPELFTLTSLVFAVAFALLLKWGHTPPCT